MSNKPYSPVAVFAPISIGNVSVGFDILGLAVAPIDASLCGDIVRIELAPSQTDKNKLTVAGSHADRLPAKAKDNIVWKCLKVFHKELEKKQLAPKTLHLILEKNIPTSSGLGSSACSVVAALAALNEFYHQPFNQHALLKLMVKQEAEISGSKHYDNVAPCYLGGMQLVVDSPDKITQQLPVFEDCYWVMAYPDVLVSTKAARDILPKTYDRQTTILYGRNLAGFIDASYRGDKKQAFAFMDDVIAEPYRKHLLPNYKVAKNKLRSLGCFAIGISGSGPTLFAVSDNKEVAEKAEQWLQQHYLQTDEGFVHICKVDTKGTRRI
ncbi:MAG: homoserine kinase [Gammaproteobacteria bacterium]|nr:homoserine kinase [Gammaproteobacteria bacterium]